MPSSDTYETAQNTDAPEMICATRECAGARSYKWELDQLKPGAGMIGGGGQCVRVFCIIMAATARYTATCAHTKGGSSGAHVKGSLSSGAYTRNGDVLQYCRVTYKLRPMNHRVGNEGRRAEVERRVVLA